MEQNNENMCGLMVSPPVAYIDCMVAAAGDDHFLLGWRGVKLLSMLLGPIQQGNVASAICVVLLSCIHLNTHEYNEHVQRHTGQLVMLSAISG